MNLPGSFHARHGQFTQTCLARIQLVLPEKDILYMHNNSKMSGLTAVSERLGVSSYLGQTRGVHHERNLVHCQQKSN